MLRAVRPTAECLHKAAAHLEHIYAGSRHLQNTDDGSNFGERWRPPHASPLRGLPVSGATAELAMRLSRRCDIRSGAGTPSNDPPPFTHPRLRRCVYLPRPQWRDADGSDSHAANGGLGPPYRQTGESLHEPACQPGERHLYGQGKPMPKDSSGSGANWGTGIQSDDPNGVLNPMNSRLDFDGTVAPTDLDRATDAREKGRIGIFGSALAYAGSSPRVTSETIGRDINPLGRGDGKAYVGGLFNVGSISPKLPIGYASSGIGNSINNPAAYRIWCDPDSSDACCRCINGWGCHAVAIMERWDPDKPSGGGSGGNCCAPAKCGCVGQGGIVKDCPDGDQVCSMDDACSKVGDCSSGAG